MRRRCLEEKRQGIPRALTPACGRVPREVSPISYISPFTLFSNPKSERFRQGWIGVGRSCLYLRYRRNYRKLLSSEILKLTQGEETEEGRTNFRSGVQRGDDGEPRAIEFLFQKLETRSFLKNKAAKPFSRAAEVARRPRRRRLSSGSQQTAFQTLAGRSGALSSVPSPPGGAAAAPAASSSP